MNHFAEKRVCDQLLAKVIVLTEDTHRTTRLPLVTREIEECAYIPYIWLRYGRSVIMKSLIVHCSYTPPCPLSSTRRVGAGTTEDEGGDIKKFHAGPVRAGRHGAQGGERRSATRYG